MIKYATFIAAIVTLTTTVAQEDPYIWLEEVESEKSMEWVNAQNKITADKLSKVEGFEALKADFLKAYNDKDKIVYPSTIGNYFYNFWKDDNHVRGIWRRMLREDYLAGKTTWETVLDIDELSKTEGKKWVFHGAVWLEPTYDRCLIRLSDGGTDENEVREFDPIAKTFVQNGFFLPSSKGSVAWLNKNELILSRNFGAGTMTTSGYPRIVKSWKRGLVLKDAKTIAEYPDTIMGAWAGSSYINGKLFAYVSKSNSFYSHETLWMHDGQLTPLKLPNDSDWKGDYKDFLILTLNSDWKIDSITYPSGSLVSVNRRLLYTGKLDVKLILTPDSKASIDGTMVTKNSLIVNVLQNVQNELHSYNFNGTEWISTKLDVKPFGRISLVDSDKDQTGYFFEYNNYITPSTLYYSDGPNVKIVQQQKALFNADNLVVHQYEAKSKDGTMIPYYIVHSKDIKYDGTNPTLVYAYGGFNISQKPGYNATTGIGWLAQGGVYVVASIRGGGEFGPEWHKAAMKEKRQNAYDDFYAVCESLIAKKITSQQHMGAFGWSNGGLMAGVVATQRPDLFNAVIIGAPLLDMKRFNKMLAGASWMGEYGNPDIPEEWAYIQKYSPYHNVHKDKKYPEVLFVTSTKDDRVHPAHARKMAARMMEQGHPIFYYETIEGGHGAASTNEQSAFNQALMYSYLKSKLTKK